MLSVLQRLVHLGATIVMVEHNTDLIRLADWAIDLGPEGGPRGGKLLYAGPPGGLLSAADSQTGQALRDEAALLPPQEPPQRAYAASDCISVRGARAQPAGRGRGVPQGQAHGGQRAVRLG